MARTTMAKQSTTKQDHLWEAIKRNYHHLQAAYEPYADKKPILLFDLQENRIYIYPYDGFIAELNENGKRLLKEQYEATLENNSKIVVFVRDNEERLLRSYTISI